jgi:hypothetical protein
MELHQGAVTHIAPSSIADSWICLACVCSWLTSPRIRGVFSQLSISHVLMPQSQHLQQLGSLISCRSRSYRTLNLNHKFASDRLLSIPSAVFRRNDLRALANQKTVLRTLSPNRKLAFGKRSCNRQPRARPLLTLTLHRARTSSSQHPVMRQPSHHT